MIDSLLKTTLRSLYREKIYTIINIVGLSIAIAVCLIVGLYIHNELSYDLHNEKHTKIYRVEQELNLNGRVLTTALTSPFLGEMLSREFPEVEEYVWFWVHGLNHLISYEDKAFYWKNYTHVSENIFNVFDHTIISGDPQTAKAGTIAVSETFAHKYFGNENPVGKVMVSEGEPLKISLVFAKQPENSHIKYDVLHLSNSKTMKLPDDEKQRNRMLWTPRYYTYLLMPEDYDRRRFKDISEAFFKRHVSEQGSRSNSSIRAWLMPLADIHYHSNVAHDQPLGNIIHLYGYFAVAVFILLIASINYINLATARAKRRAKEVGMRKIFCSSRISLIMKFLSEAIILSFISVLFAMLLVELVLTLTPLNNLMGISLSLGSVYKPYLLVIVFGVSLFFGLLSGAYPAFYLSSIVPLSALLKTHQAGKSSFRLRGMLVFTQFTISVCVTVCTFLMLSQLRYVSNKLLGFEKENRLTVTLHGPTDKTSTIKKELLKNHDILGVSLTSTLFGVEFGVTSAGIRNNDNATESTIVNFLEVDKDFLDVIGIKYLTKKNIPLRSLGGDEPLYIVNEATVKAYGWLNPLDKKILTRNREKFGDVFGVVRDFNYSSLHNPIEPIILKILPNEKFRTTRNFLILKVSGDDTKGTIEYIENRFKEFDPEHPLEFQFLEDALNIEYSSEYHLMKLIGIFAGICIFISCLGVIGLTSFNIEERKKEIAVRRVFGASSRQIIIMLGKNTLLFVLYGSVISSFLAYFLMDKWMMDFAYRININDHLLEFLLAAGITAGVAFTTVVFQSYKTTQENPARTLRYE